MSRSPLPATNNHHRSRSSVSLPQQGIVESSSPAAVAVTVVVPSPSQSDTCTARSSQMQMEHTRSPKRRLIKNAVRDGKYPLSRKHIGDSMMESGPGDNLRGWLLKWTNYIKGYQRRWFVLNEGILSYYRSQAEMKYTCRGTMYLSNAAIVSLDTYHFVIKNGSTTMHLKAGSEAEKQKWIAALELAKSKAVKFDAVSSDYDDSELDSNEVVQTNPMTVTSADKGKSHQLNMDISELEASYELARKQQQSLQKIICTISDFYHSLISEPAAQSILTLTRNDETSSGPGSSQSSTFSSSSPVTLASALSTLEERATVFRVTTTALVNNCKAYLNIVSKQRHHFQRAYNQEREQRIRLEDVIEKMAKQQKSFEKNVVRAVKRGDQHVNPIMSDSEYRGSRVTHVTTSGTTSDAAIIRRNQLSSGLKTSAGLLTSRGGSTTDDGDDDDVFHDALDEDLLRMPVGGLMEEEKKKQQQQEQMQGPSRRTPVQLGIAATGIAYEEEGADSCSSLDEDDEYDDDEFDEETECRSSRKMNTKHPSVLIKLAPSQEAEDIRDSRKDKTIVGKDTLLSQKTRERRKTVPLKPEYSLNLWSIIKNCVGKDLSRIPIPVNFSEPLSMLQRLTEELEYSSLLDEAAKCEDSRQQMAYVAAFTISVYSTTADRAAKPFNPLQGETYECDRTEDLGWRSFAEQVSHHPPSLANHAEGKEWTLWQEFTMTSKFRAQYLSVTPLGYSHLIFPRSGNRYSWKKVTTCVQNIIVGKLWIDNIGEMDIQNHKTGDKCHLKFYQYSMFSKDEPRKVAGIITDSKLTARYVLNGKWNESMAYAEVKNPGILGSVSRFETRPPVTIWKRVYPPEYLSRMYNLTTLAIQLNEMEPGVAPTDSRMRPDQRLMENGMWDEANVEKLRLEEKQRESRKENELENERRKESGQEPIIHKPRWFIKKHDEDTNTDIHVFTNEYWDAKLKQDWTGCPDIF